mgnify:CR=1 FL=1
MKRINSMLQVVQGDITDAANWQSSKIDTIVNAAKPTLMGSNQGGDVHNVTNLTSRYSGVCNAMR